MHREIIFAQSVYIILNSRCLADICCSGKDSALYKQAPPFVQSVKNAESFYGKCGLQIDALFSIMIKSVLWINWVSYLFS